MTLEDYIVKKYKEQTNIDLSTDSIAMYMIKEAAEKALDELKENIEVEVNLPFITADKEGPLHLNFVIDRDWDKPEVPVSDNNEIVFQKSVTNRKITKNQIILLIILTLFFVFIIGLLAFLMM